VRAIAEVYVDPKLDDALRTNVAIVLGSLRPNARRSGDLLLQYQPPPPGAPAPKQDAPKQDAPKQDAPKEEK
jgi:hypothetical protein